MQYGVAKNRIKLAIESESGGIEDTSVKTTFECSPDLLGAAVDRHNAAPGCDELFSEGAVTATEIEHALTTLLIE